MDSAGTVQDGWSDDWHLQDSDGGTCLHAACKAGHVDVAKYLIKVGGKELLMLTGHVSAFLWSFVQIPGTHIHFIKHAFTPADEHTYIYK